MTDEHLCILCPHLRPGSKPRLYEHAQACDTCRVRLEAIPGEIATAHALLVEILEPPRGTTGTRTAVAASLPLAVDPFDLLANHWPPQGSIHRGRLAANADLQVGHLPVAATLATWVDDWATIRDQREARNVTNWWVHDLAHWLAGRTAWACDEHPAVDEYAAELLDLRHTLFRLVGHPEPNDRPVQLEGQPCPRCRHLTIWRHRDGDTECQHPDCGSIWRPDEYQRVTKAIARHVGTSLATIH